MNTTKDNIILNPEVLSGEIVEGVGFTMLAKIEGGKKYRIEFSERRYGGAIFTFFRPKGMRAIVSHYASSVASSIKATESGGCNNGLKRA